MIACIQSGFYLTQNAWGYVGIASMNLFPNNCMIYGNVLEGISTGNHEEADCIVNKDSWFEMKEKPSPKTMNI